MGAIAATACRQSGSSQQVPAQTAATTARRRLERVGIQLYSVRSEMQRDMPGTLARLAQIGYRDVEFAGYFGRTPEQVRQMLDSNGLAAPSTHVPYEMLRDNFGQAAASALVIGHRYLTVPFLGNSFRTSAATWKSVAADFNRFGEQAKARGLQFAYHNHDFEFVPVEGQVPLDLLLANTDPALVSFEMDVYWTVKAGADPLAYFRRHPDRFSMLHIKDSSGAPEHRQVDVGAGTIDFASIFRLDAAQRHTVRHAFVEADQPADPMQFAKNSFDNLSRLEY